MSTNSQVGDQSVGQTDAANKRAALAGQWRTPPLPAFPTGGFSQPQQQQAPPQSHHQHQPVAQPPPHPQQQAAPQSQIAHHPPAQQGEPIPDLPDPQAIPDNSEDYAKALQEAYRKGAEAAAILAQQQNMPTAASCPNFSSTAQHQAAQPPPSQPMGVMVEESAYAASTAHSAPGHPAVAAPQAPQPVRPDPLTSSMPPPPPTVPVQPPQPAAAPQQHPPQPQYATHGQPPPQQHPQQPQPAGRSVSLPDMSAYAAQAEEEKRQKRLARNRASARLRRLRKKNLVDAYETEVGILEKTLKQLQAHEWGQDDNHVALLDALGMERGQQAISPDQRGGIIKDILNQQMQQVELLRQSQLEQECLRMMVENKVAGENQENIKREDDDDLIKELQDVLQLTDSQKQEILTSSKGLDNEVEALETVSASLQAMQENEWLLNEGVQNVTDQFTSILHKNQLSKFLLWTDANVEAIDQLDHVQVQPLQTAPIFTFGVETTPVDDEEK